MVDERAHTNRNLPASTPSVLGSALKPTSTSGVSVKGISKAYNEVPTLCDISFDVAEGSLLSIVGPSGSGKSTLLEIMAGLRAPDDGEVMIGSQKIVRPDKSVGVMFQEDTTLPWRTVTRNVAFPLEAMKHRRADIRVAVERVLKVVGLWDYRESYPHELSGGMRQRVALARVLVSEPSLVLLDEPFGALDEQLRMRLGLDVTRISRDLGRTAVLITHSIQEAVLLSDRVLVLSKRPASIVLDMGIDLSWPRSMEMLSSPAATTAAADIWHALET